MENYMLKIRDRVSESELRELGFQDSDDRTCWILITNDIYEGIVISKKTRRIKVFLSGQDIVSDKTMCALYYIIDNGLTEKTYYVSEG